MRPPATNAVIAASAFFVLLFVILTLRNFDNALKNTQISTSVDDVKIRHPPANQIGEGKLLCIFNYKQLSS